ncbi:uncharacterized protein STEHIDRAFT_162755 [Stereum hirsutum FP-91666 SS1]|uniref:Uncharacterized protein n=1 Tax=Stereum hirsutum (strain FP-91666) TaxID=721885 RepID=R7RY55_STEHR|nr:uncharacterized protein STEHIDRAFT_162755 [Stereum hirsutum FP-91666 SS1]EIM80336.1 hypothetical protein STEHIDRAFT_162755 [Stereum hirsutum FP-91666 SS1]
MSILFIFMTTILLKAILLAWLRAAFHSLSQSELAQDTYSYEGSDFPRTWSIDGVDRVSMFVEDTTHYQLESSVVGDGFDSDAEWDLLVPGDGLVYLGDNKRPFSVTVFHQLRCLNIIRKHLVLVARHELSGPREDRSRTLTTHCANYLRQMALCHADLDLDTAVGKPEVSVMPDVYECHDWSRFYEKVERNQYQYMTWSSASSKGKNSTTDGLTD